MENKHYSVAIDGPAGAGKSTIAKQVARELGYIYVDTGAIYRTVGYHMSLMGISPKDKDGVERLLDDVNVEITYDGNGLQHMILNGADVSDEIRTQEIAKAASQVSAQKCVRAFLLDLQRDMAKKHSVIMDGRDIGTVVLPRADVKIYLTASAEVRAKRRLLELEEKGQKTDFNTVLREIKERDHQDMTRTIAPLKKAADAIEIDTSDLTLEESVAAIRDAVKNKLGL